VRDEEFNSLFGAKALGGLKAAGRDSLALEAKGIPSAYDWRTFWTLLGLAAVILLLWNTPLLYPLKILVVFFHELSHGLMAKLTGGRIVQIQLSALEGGLCITAGGNRFLTLSAGYLGSLLWGGLIIVLAARTRMHRLLCSGLGIMVLLVALAYVRPLIGFGFLFCLLAGIGILIAGLKLGAEQCRYLLKLIGLTSCLYAPLDIFADTVMGSHLPSDAWMLSQFTGIPTAVHGVIWIALSLIIGVWMLALACRNPAYKSLRRR
jgi:hypothetical protein